MGGTATSLPFFPAVNSESDNLESMCSFPGRWAQLGESVAKHLRLLAGYYAKIALLSSDRAVPITRRQILGTIHSGRLFRWGVLGLLGLLAVAWAGSNNTAGKAGSVWVRLELVENSADGPAFNRCELEETLNTHHSGHSSAFFGLAEADAARGWKPIRPQSSCETIASNSSSNVWTLGGSPYLLVDVTLKPTAISDKEVRIQVSLLVRRLTAFGKDTKPIYDERNETRELVVPVNTSTIVPVFIANQRETEAFDARELLLRFLIGGSQPRFDYGEISVSADVPRAMIFIDGGLVGRTSSDAPFVLDPVTTGKHEIAIMDASGRETRTVIQVEKGSRASVSLTLMPKSMSAGPSGLRSLGRNPQAAEEFWREKDGAIVVRIPGTEFRMGSAGGKGEANEHPQHPVRVQDFLMDKTEVTWGQYKRFLAASGHPSPKSPPWGMLDAFPASGIKWDEAAAFCTWAGARLPTEAEWERAARGDDSRQYPWGNTFDPWRCNTRDGGPHAPTAAAEYPDCVNSFGVLDLAGSVSEWCSDWLDDAYYANSPVQNPTGPKTGTRRVSRGGGWMTPAQSASATARVGIDPSWRGPMQGFRCVQDDRKAEAK